MKIKSSIDRMREKMQKRDAQIRGRRTISEEEIREALYLKGKVLVDDLAERIRFCLWGILISGIISIFFPPLLVLPGTYCFFLFIVFLRYMKYSTRLKAFQKNGQYVESGLELGKDRKEKGTLTLVNKESRMALDIYCSGFKPSRQKAALYVAAIPAIMVAIIDEDGTGYWYDPVEDE